ncbi:MAG: AAA family ATPase [Lentisphaeria bacterium]|jgi:predicted ATPase
MKPSITELTVSGFRALRDFSVKELGRANLITGRNNTGKSSVLEALRILTSNADPSVIFSILSSREDNVDNLEKPQRLDETDPLLWLAGLFTGFPQSIKDFQPIQIKAAGGQHSLELTLRLAWPSRGHYSISENQQAQSILYNQNIREPEAERGPALIITAPNMMREIPLESLFRRPPYGSRPYRSEFGEKQRLQCAYVSPYDGEKTANLGALWDNIALSDGEKDVVHALQIIEPSISAVSMIGGKGARPRTAIVRSKNFQRPLPLRSFGDGLNRLFNIALSLVNAKGGLLLIDEFENGMHHTVQLDVWRAIFRLAQDLDVQVFATSHSWDAVEAFQKAAAETTEDATLIRLSRQDDAVIPTLFKKDELAVATRDGIEVR